MPAPARMRNPAMLCRLGALGSGRQLFAKTNLGKTARMRRYCDSVRQIRREVTISRQPHLLPRFVKGPPRSAPGATGAAGSHV